MLVKYEDRSVSPNSLGTIRRLMIREKIRGLERERGLLDNLPLLTQNLVDDLYEFVAAKVLERIEMPTGLMRDLVT